MPVPGTQSVIQLLPRLVAMPGRRVAIFAPTYGEYARVFPAAGFAVDEIYGCRITDAGAWAGDRGQSEQSDGTRLSGRTKSLPWRDG